EERVRAPLPRKRLNALRRFRGVDGRLRVAVLEVRHDVEELTTTRSSSCRTGTSTRGFTRASCSRPSGVSPSIAAKGRALCSSNIGTWRAKGLRALSKSVIMEISLAECGTRAAEPVPGTPTTGAARDGRCG